MPSKVQWTTSALDLQPGYSTQATPAALVGHGCAPAQPKDAATRSVAFSAVS